MQESSLMHAVEMMIRTNHMHRAMIDSGVRSLGIHRTQHRILMHLARQGRLPSQKDLAEHLEITPAAVTCALRKIEQDGYVERTIGHDNRYNELCITEKGKALVAQTREMFCEADSAIFKNFSDEELKLFIQCMEKLQANIRKQCERKEKNEEMV